MTDLYILRFTGGDRPWLVVSPDGRELTRHADLPAADRAAGIFEGASRAR